MQEEEGGDGREAACRSRVTTCGWQWDKEAYRVMSLQSYGGDSNRDEGKSREVWDRS